MNYFEGSFSRKVKSKYVNEREEVIVQHLNTFKTLKCHSFILF